MPNRIRGIRQGIPGGYILGRRGSADSRGPASAVSSFDASMALQVASGAPVGNAGSGSASQSTGNITDGQVMSNISGVDAVPSGSTLTLIIDHVLGATQGQILYRNATAWVVLAPGTSGFFLKTNGAAANPAWASAAAAASATYQAQPANPTGTTDTTGKMMGLAGTLTPTHSGKILIVISGNIANDTILDGAKVQIYTGTGAAPANGDAITGTARGNIPTATMITAATPEPFSINAVVTGLALATAYWIDVSLAAITGGTASITNLSVSIAEL